MKYLILLLLCVMACGKDDDNDAPVASAVVDPEAGVDKVALKKAYNALLTVKKDDTFDGLLPEARDAIFTYGERVDFDTGAFNYKVGMSIDDSQPRSDGNCYFSMVLHFGADKIVDDVSDLTDSCEGSLY
jgi:hypothetical protein